MPIPIFLQVNNCSKKPEEGEILCCVPASEIHRNSFGCTKVNSGPSGQMIFSWILNLKKVTTRMWILKESLAKFALRTFVPS